MLLQTPQLSTELFRVEADPGGGADFQAHDLGDLYVPRVAHDLGALGR
ncbi:hypothetical protein [Streptomyces xiamenensis]